MIEGFKWGYRDGVDEASTDIKADGRNMYLVNCHRNFHRNPGILIALSLAGCGEREKVDGEELVLRAIEEYRAFSKAVSEKQDAEIDLSYLDDKFPGVEICNHHGYGFYQPIKRKIEGKTEIYFNDRPSAESMGVVVVSKRYAFIKFTSDYNFGYKIPFYPNDQMNFGCVPLKHYKLKSTNGNIKDYYNIDRVWR